MGTNRCIQISHRQMGDEYPCFIIAEICVNFNVSLELAKKTIDAAVKCGADAVKFQTFHADGFVAHRDL